MKGDFTRDTFDRARQFSRVLMQQGRVQVDADWNEQTSILLHYLRTLAADILGPHAGPNGAMGFGLITSDIVATWSGDPEVKWKEIEPDQKRREILKEGVQSGDMAIGSGRYYVQGILVENPHPILYTEQPGYPFTEETQLENLQEAEWLAYLDVWERHVTFVQNDTIREVALGGADTCTRAQVVWQVKALLRPAPAGAFGCGSLESLARELPRLKARALRGAPSADLCSVSPQSRYLGLENHLYRVEVHEVGVAVPGGSKKGKSATTSATFKWSRENGSVVIPIVSLSGSTVVVANLGRAECSLLKPGDWVEVCDDDLAFREQSGMLARVEAVDREELKITLKWPGSAVDLPSYAEADAPIKHPLLRRWDHAGDLAAYEGALRIVESTSPQESWIPLEDGVEIWFAPGGQYRPGDYWLIPARVASGNVEWPLELDANGVPKSDAPIALPPHGPLHYYAPLFLVNHGDIGEDCRCRIEHLECVP